MLTIYVYDPSRKGLRYLKTTLKKIIKQRKVAVKIMAMTTNSILLMKKIKPQANNLILLPYQPSENAFLLAKAVRAKDPEAFIVYWIQEPVDYLEIIQSNIEVVDVLDKRQEAFVDKLLELIIWTEGKL